MINPDLLHVDSEDGNTLSNAPVPSTVVDNLLLPNEEFTEIYLQLNDGQQHLFNFMMQYETCCGKRDQLLLSAVSKRS